MIALFQDGNSKLKTKLLVKKDYFIEKTEVGERYLLDRILKKSKDGVYCHLKIFGTDDLKFYILDEKFKTLTFKRVDGSVVVYQRLKFGSKTIFEWVLNNENMVFHLIF